MRSGSTTSNSYTSGLCARSTTRTYAKPPGNRVRRTELLLGGKQWEALGRDARDSTEALDSMDTGSSSALLDDTRLK
jgi:hypothetical protein